jgi:succinyl-CoA synthetase alpha subunit
MSILVDGSTRLVVQGITGREGAFHATRNKAYGTQVVAGVTPGKAGQDVDGIPVFNTVADAVEATGANTAMVFVPPRFAADAIYEAIESDVELVICITEGIPAHDMLRVYTHLKRGDKRLIGPNCPGVITPGTRTRVGIMPGDVFTPGPIGLISRSGTLVYEGVAQLTALAMGQSTCIGVGGDPVIGTTQREALELLNNDSETKAVVLQGEIGGTAEQDAADYIKNHMSKPVVAFIAGSTAPPGRRMGHAGAIIAGNAGTAAAKKQALADAGATIVESPAEIGRTTLRVLKERGLM